MALGLACDLKVLDCLLCKAERAQGLFQSNLWLLLCRCWLFKGVSSSRDCGLDHGILSRHQNPFLVTPFAIQLGKLGNATPRGYVEAKSLEAGMQPCARRKLGDSVSLPCHVGLAGVRHNCLQEGGSQGSLAFPQGRVVGNSHQTVPWPGCPQIDFLA